MSALPPLLALVLAAVASATPARTPVIEAGREAEILALVRPFVPDGEVVAGFALTGIEIARDTVLFRVTARDGRGGALRLAHPFATPSAERTASFALARELPPDDPGAEAAVAALAAAVQRNDPGGFWRTTAAAPPAAGDEDDARDRLLTAAGRWVLDGLVLALVGLVLLALLVARALRRTPASVGLLLLAASAVGALVRLLLAPDTTLEAWGFGRIPPLAARIAAGPGLGLVAGEVYLTELVGLTTLGLALVTPPAVFVLGRTILRGSVGPLAAATALALLPLHVRFSRSDVALVQAVVLEAATLGLLVLALEGTTRPRLTAALVALAGLATATFLTRPEEVAFLPVLLAGSLVLGDGPVPRARRLLAAGVLASVGVAVLVGFVAARHGHEVGEGLRFSTLVDGVRALVRLRTNTLVNPAITPPGFLVLALLGMAVGLRARAERARTLLLVAWLFGFFLVHAYVLPREIAMQARYHLHLVLPFVLLVGAGVATCWRWRRWTAVPLVVYALAAPVLHRDFIGDVAFDTPRELAFLRRLRARVPEGCTVLEYRGPAGAEMASRVTRVGTYYREGAPFERWNVVTVSATDAASLTAALLREPPGCLVAYEGLTCWSEKPLTAAVAPACAALEEVAPGVVLDTVTFAPRPYDESLAKGYLDTDAASLRLRLTALRWTSD